MNVNEAGKQPVMRDGYYTKNGNRHEQQMHVDGVPKGLKRVLQERGLFNTGMKQEDMVAVLSAQADFKEQKPFVQEWIERRGHVCIFWPHFHR
jgi:hypothetical protein